MYTAPLLDEIVSVVVHQLDAQLDKETLLALAITNRSLSNAALDVLWADSSIWSLSQRMDSSIWVLEEAESSAEYDKGDLVSIANLDTCTQPQIVPLCSGTQIFFWLAFHQSW
jgi:hypothetical protein